MAAALEADALALVALADALSLAAEELAALEADALALDDAALDDELPPHAVSTNASDSVRANAAIFPMVFMLVPSLKLVMPANQA